MIQKFKEMLLSMIISENLLRESMVSHQGS